MEPRTQSLVERFLAGDAASYEVLFKRYHAPLERYLWNRTDAALRDQVSVAELIQETHVEALDSLDRFEYRQELAFFYWLCAIARHRIARHCRRLRRSPPVAAPLSVDGSQSQSPSREPGAKLPDTAPTALDQLLRQENLHLVAVCLDKLDHRRRKAVVLTSLEGLSGEAAAARMGISHGAFRVLRARALADLAESLHEVSRGG